LLFSPQLWRGLTDKPAKAGSTGIPSAEDPDHRCHLTYRTPCLAGRPLAFRQRLNAIATSCLQLCIDQGALAHPSDANFEPRLGIFAALPKTSCMLSG